MCIQGYVTIANHGGEAEGSPTTNTILERGRGRGIGGVGVVGQEEVKTSDSLSLYKRFHVSRFPSKTYLKYVVLSDQSNN